MAKRKQTLLRELRLLEKRLCSLPRGLAELEIRLLDGGTLVALVDSEVEVIAETAAEMLAIRGAVRPLSEGLIAGGITTRLGKLRALKALHRVGATGALVREAYLAALADHNIDVLEHALFGLVSFEDESVVTHLREAFSSAPTARHRERIARAIDAIASKSPHLFAPYFHDEINAWRLRRNLEQRRI